jgi:GT2 family glycosyltransferase
MRRLRIVSATRESRETFKRTCLLGTSMRQLLFDARITSNISCQNSLGLSTIYNRAIKDAEEDDVLLFVHDDIFIHDFNLSHRIEEALAAFDVVGLAGNVNPNANHVGWAMWRDEQKNLKLEESALLSGIVGHFTAQGEVICEYGPTPRQCLLMDGCFLAASARALREKGIWFDERFQFHFYDLDFCRTCVQKGLRLGTWPIAVTHGSGGAYGSPPWEAALKIYQEKWPIPTGSPSLPMNQAPST